MKNNSENSTPLTSIVVASYDRPGYLPRALDSIASQSYQNLEIIVVDNRSRSSEEIAAIVGRYERVKLIRNSENVGFTGAMNRGLAEATGKYVYFTLDDVVLDRDCITRFVEHAEQHELKGLLSGILLTEDGQTVRCAGGEYKLGAVYHRKLLRIGERATTDYQPPYQVMSVPGGAIFTTVELARRLKGFRREFFMYSEDADLCMRVAKAGGVVTIVPAARVYIIDAPHSFTHKGIAFHKIKNLFSLYLLHARLRVLPEFYLRYGVVNLLRALKSDRAIVWPMIKAWAWFLVNAPAFLMERYRRVSL